ncbi:hypothetical protein OROMI_033760 [Orobanche minor]
MFEDLYTLRTLFGGAIVSTFPLRFEDVSNIRQVPDHQSVPKMTLGHLLMFPELWILICALGLFLSASVLWQARHTPERKRVYAGRYEKGVKNRVERGRKGRL